MNSTNHDSPISYAGSTAQAPRQRLFRSAGLLALLMVLATAAALAHPMGNFSVNHYAKITLTPEGIDLRYFIDLAEIPTYQELQQYALTPSDPASVTAFLTQRGPELQHGLSLRLAGDALPLHLVSKGVIFPAGAGGLPTLKMGYVFRAAYPAGRSAGAVDLAYSDANYPGHAGWKEVVVVGPPSLLTASSAPPTDRSAELSNYPTDMLNSPPQELSATARVNLASLIASAVPGTSSRGNPAQASALAQASATKATPQIVALSHRVPAHAPAASASLVKSNPSKAHSSDSRPTVQQTSPGPARQAPTMHLEANRQSTARSAFTELVTAQHFSPWFLFTAAFISIGLGALHALEPGHGKTIVAAYLVGSRGTARHALLLGVIVTVAHTASVFALGAVTLYASHYILPEQLYPWLSLLSGLTIAALGAYMLLRRWTGETLDHDHAAGEMHNHWFSRRQPAFAVEPLAPGLGATTIETVAAETLAQAIPGLPAKPPISLTQLFTLGITGGIIPCPAALVVLLSAFALHRVGFGFFLITMFSIGLASVLIGFGLLIVYGRRFFTRLAVDGPITRRWLPVASAAFMSILGIVIAWRGFAATGLSLHSFSQERLGPGLFVAGLGLVLGMRHSTDADHVVAISTIVTRQRSIRGAAVIGALWGLGHTLTIFAVGCLIILGGVVIPPRIGLSMEFSVGLMLILLGVLNLSGVMQKIVSRFTPAQTLADKRFMPLQAEEDNGLDALANSPKAPQKYGAYQLFRPLAIGLVHGLAGSAAVALLVLSTIHNPLYAIGYLVIFGGGTMLGMMIMTAAMAMPLVWAGGRLPQLSRYLSVASGLVSVCFGMFLVYQLGYLNGLFTGHPHWTPQ